MAWRGLAAVLAALLISACSDSTGTGASSGTSGAGSTGSSGSSSSGGSGASPITAPDDTWTWVDFPDSKCANGSPTGMGINPHSGSTDLLIYLEGGGACSSGASCWGPDPTASALDGYDAAKFAATPQLHLPIFARGTRVGSPFASANQVFVPYCTGDLHAGTAEVDLAYGGTSYPTWFWGAKDIDLFMARVKATFPGVERVWLAGGSAGGFGSFLAYQNVTAAFPGLRVDIIDDSGPAISPKGATSNPTLARYGFQPPAGCASPCDSHAKVLASDRAAQPNSKYAFLSYAEDPTISADMGYTLDEYPAVIDDYVSSLSSDPNAAAFVVTNKQSHVVDNEPQLAPEYLPWLTLMVNDDSSWADVTYQHP